MGAAALSDEESTGPAAGDAGEPTGALQAVCPYSRYRGIWRVAETVGVTGWSPSSHG